MIESFIGVVNIVNVFIMEATMRARVHSGGFARREEIPFSFEMLKPRLVKFLNLCFFLFFFSRISRMRIRCRTILRSFPLPYKFFFLFVFKGPIKRKIGYTR